MYLTCVRHTVKDFARWKAAFDENAPTLEEAGVLSTQIVQVNGNALDVAVINTWPSQKEWDAFVILDTKRHADYKAIWEKAGVMGEPTFFGGDIV